MVTYSKISRIVKSYVYRKRLAESTNELEEKITSFMRENEKEVLIVGKYKLAKDDGSLKYSEVPYHDPRQRELFDKEEYQKGGLNKEGNKESV